MMKMLNRSLVCLGITNLLALSVAGVGPVFAQEDGAQQASGLEEVIVTARKREESLQEVPVAVTAVTGETLENGGVNTLIDAQKFAPNVKLTHNSFVSGGLSASIRGLAFDDLEKSFEPTVGVSIDGVFLGNNSGADMDLFDVESIEILRGPQGTLFGRNTIGGVMNVRRTRPTGEFGGKVMVDLARYDYRDYKGILNFPIVEGKLAGKVRLRRLESDSFQYNVTRGESAKGRDLKSASASLLFTPSDNFDALLTFDRYDDESYPPELVNTSTANYAFCSLLGLPNGLGCASASGDLAKAADYKLSFSPRPFITTIDGHNWTLNMNWDLGDFTLTSITGTQNFDELLDIENTGAPIELVLAYRDQTYKQFSEELRIASNWSKPLNFVAGVMYFGNEYTVFQNLSVLVGLVNDFTSTQNLDAYAAFGEATYDINDKLRLTAGLRYTAEEKDIWQDNRMAGYTLDKTEDWNDLTHRVGLDYHVTDDTMLYATWSTGFRSGGWNARGQSVTEVGPYDPEDIDNYEVGIRSEFLEHRLRLNLTGFIMDYKNKQIPFVRGRPGTTAVDTVVTNAAAVDYSGFELEGIARPFDADVNLRLAVGYLDAEYKEYYQGEGGPNVADDAVVLFAPKWTFSVGGDWTTKVGGGELRSQVTWSYTDDSYGTGPIPPDPEKLDVIPNYNSLDLSLNYRYPMSDDNTFFVTLYGTNILTEGAELGRPYVVVGTWAWTGPEIARNYGLQVGIEF